jgi:Uma2 family endonuclease
VLSPDAALVRLDRWQALSAERRRGFPPLCPDLVVELASPGDGSLLGVEALRRKMAAYQANGAQLGWLMLPKERADEIWPSRGDARRIEASGALEGGEAFPGLGLELMEIWES